MIGKSKRLQERQLEIEQFRRLLSKLGLYPTEEGARQASHARRGFVAGLHRAIDRLAAADLFALEVIANRLDPYEGMDKRKWYHWDRDRPIVRRKSEH